MRYHNLKSEHLSKYDYFPLIVIKFIMNYFNHEFQIELSEFVWAEGILEELLEEDDRILEVMHLLAVCAFHQQQYEAAIKYLEGAFQLIQIEEENKLDSAAAAADFGGSLFFKVASSSLKVVATS